MISSFSKIIQGCMNWGIWGKSLTKKEMIELLIHDIDLGITTFDHADIYGDYTTEKQFGDAFLESGIEREKIQLISKCGIQYMGKTRNNVIKHYQYDVEYIVWSVEKSIKDLQSEYLDLLLLHRPSPLMEPSEIAIAVDKLLSQGKIRAFGVSNFTPSQIDLISSKFRVTANQIEFSLTSHNAMHDGTLDYMMCHNIVPMSWKPLGNIFKSDDKQILRINILLEELGKKYHATKEIRFYQF